MKPVFPTDSFQINLRYPKNTFSSAEDFMRRVSLSMRRHVSEEQKERFCLTDSDPKLPGNFRQTVSESGAREKRKHPIHWLLDRYIDLRLFGAFYVKTPKPSLSSEPVYIPPSAMVGEPVEKNDGQWLSIIWNGQESSKNRVTQEDRQLFLDVAAKPSNRLEIKEVDSD